MKQTARGFTALLQIQAKDPLEQRVQWLVQLMRWLRGENIVGVSEAFINPSLRLRYFFSVLEKNPETKLPIAATLRSLLRELSTFELFCEVGLPRELAIGQELVERLEYKLLPQIISDKDMKQLFYTLFPEPQDADWIESLEAEVFDQILGLLSYEMESEQDWNTLRQDMEDAILSLTTQVSALGFAPQVRKRLGKKDFRTIPFYSLNEKARAFLRHKSVESVLEFRNALADCEGALQEAHSHMQEYGVSVKVVYQIERMQFFLKRIYTLVHFLMDKNITASEFFSFASRLVRENLESRSLRSLVEQNLHLLARKIVERSAESGEHYIANTPKEYLSLLLSAGGGGLITAITCFVKVGVGTLHLPTIYDGIVSTLNYGLSFLGIHFAGFTLATKQPAMTAPALADRMHGIEGPQQMQALVDEIAKLVRSQVAAILGNLGFVIPSVLLFHWAYSVWAGQNLMGLEKATTTLLSTNIIGPTLFFAAFTGVLLFLSSLAAGWTDNFIAFHGLQERVARHEFVRRIFGRAKAEKIGQWLKNHAAAISSNLTLAFFLGMVPAVAYVFRLPIEVRHVTLSTGSLVAAIPTLGMEIFSQKEFYLAAIGILCTGALNLGVSFLLAFMTAIRAREIEAPQRRAIYRALFLRFKKKPLMFFIP